MKLTMDKTGRIVLPKPIRDELHLEPGDALEIESSGEDITLRPLRGEAQLRKKNGVWVYRTGEPLSAATVEKTVRLVQRERDASSLGEDL
jgi:AbrB family looped-hinge helix DNA binding protein